MDMLDKEVSHVPGKDSARFHQATQNDAQLITYKLFTELFLEFFI